MSDLQRYIMVQYPNDCPHCWDCGELQPEKDKHGKWANADEAETEIRYLRDLLDDINAIHKSGKVGSYSKERVMSRLDKLLEKYYTRD